MPKLLLLDGHSLAYRAFFALPDRPRDKAGTVTNAVYGFTSMLTKVMADEKPDHIAVAFDAPGGSTYRYELDPEYKAGRKETPDLFRSQLPLIHEVLEALEITQLEVPGVEADDVIATLATRAAAEGMDVVIVTGDRDSFQLVHDPHVKVLYNKRGVSDYALYDEAGIWARRGRASPCGGALVVGVELVPEGSSPGSSTRPRCRRGARLPSTFTSIEVNPKTAFVTVPLGRRQVGGERVEGAVRERQGRRSGGASAIDKRSYVAGRSAVRVRRSRVSSSPAMTRRAISSTCPRLVIAWSGGTATRPARSCRARP